MTRLLSYPGMQNAGLLREFGYEHTVLSKELYCHKEDWPTMKDKKSVKFTRAFRLFWAKS